MCQSGESASGVDHHDFGPPRKSAKARRPSPRVRNIPCDLHYEDRGLLSVGIIDEILIGSSTAAALA